MSRSGINSCLLAIAETIDVLWIGCQWSKMLAADRGKVLKALAGHNRIVILTGSGLRINPGLTQSSSAGEASEEHGRRSVRILSRICDSAQALRKG